MRRKDGDTITRIVLSGHYPCSCVCTDDGKSLLHLAGPAECVVCVSILLSSPDRCYVDGPDFYGNTPLHDVAAVCQSLMTNVIAHFYVVKSTFFCFRCF